MAKFYGKVGYVELVEISPGIWDEVVTERSSYGDMTRNARRIEGSNEVNSGIVINNEISIIADPYARQNFHQIRYIEFMGTKWSVTNVEVQYPRLKFTLGGVYNGKPIEPTEQA